MPNTVIIKNLGVDTLQIKGNAVTIPVSAEAATGATVGVYLNQVLELEWTSSGAPTFVIFTCGIRAQYGSGQFIYQIKLDGTYVAGASAGKATAAGGLFTGGHEIEPTAGERTLTFWVQGSHAQDIVMQRSAYIQEVKK